MPVNNPEFVAKIAAEFFVVVANVNHGSMMLALNQNVAIRQLPIALIVISVNDPTNVVVRNVSVFQNPDRIVRHNRARQGELGAVWLGGCVFYRCVAATTALPKI